MSVPQHSPRPCFRFSWRLAPLLGRLPLQMVLTVPLLLLIVILITTIEWFVLQADRETIKAVLMQGQVAEAEQIAVAIAQAQVANIRSPLLVINLGVVVGIGTLAMWLSYQLAQPWRYLSQVSQAVLAGVRKVGYPPNPIAEIDTLSQSCAPMAWQLQQFFEHMQVALEQSEAKFSTIFRASPDAIGIIRLGDLQIIEANDCFLELFGYTREELIGQRIDQLNLWSDPKQQQQFLPDLKARHNFKNREVYYQTKRGGKKVILLSTQLIHIEGEACALCISKDITERKRTEQKLLRQEQEFRALVEHIPDIVARLSPRKIGDEHNQYEFLYINSKIEQILSIPAAQFIHKTSEELLFPVDFITSWNAALDRVFATGKDQQLNYTPTNQDGRQYWSAQLVPEFDADGRVETVLVLARDITDLKQAEIALRQNEERLRHILENMPVMLDAVDENWQLIVWNRECEKVTGYSAEEIIHNPQAFSWLYPDAAYRETMLALWQGRGNNYRNWEWEITCKDGTRKTISWSNISDEFPIQGWGAWGIGVDISDRKQAEHTLQQRIQHERLITTITQHIRQSLELQEILNATVTEIQHLLQADRVLVYQLMENGTITVIAEAVVPGFLSVLGKSLPLALFAVEAQELYRQGQVQVIVDIRDPDLGLSPDLIEIIEQWSVCSKLIVPVLMPSTVAQASNSLWGLVVVQQCTSIRQWQPIEVELLTQLADQVAIAIQQSELYQQLQKFNMALESEVQERTRQLRQAFEFEATLKHITDQVRDHLDEAQILQTAVEALARALGSRGCNAALYDLEAQTSTIKYEYTTFSQPFRNYKMRMQNFAVGYQQLLAGQCFQYCSLSPYPQRGRVATLACPMQTDQGVLGDVWVINEPHYGFTEQDIRLVQQVANQCAIALRQARLYQASLAQVRELERLNQLKDDFLSTVSHELRTPLSNMNSALHMLQLFLEQPGLFSEQAETLRIKPDRAFQYLDVMRSQYQQELGLVNDLLDLSRLEAGTELPTLVTVELDQCLPAWVNAFQERAKNQQQTLSLSLEATLPPFLSDPLMLERTIGELIHNACKYTPPDGTIAVAATAMPTVIQITVTNTGSEIPTAELPYIFDKFYRVPSGDRWKHGGTGLGLTLVKRRVELLGGSITVVSQAMQTCFTIEFPLG